jgi:hypothetical protein
MSQGQSKKKNELVPVKPVMGRPVIDIDQYEFENLCRIQCTQLEIAQFFNCSIHKIQDWCDETYGLTFPQCYERFKGTGKVSLRRAQFRLAVEEGHAGMLMWLGKQMLDQKDTPPPQPDQTNPMVLSYDLNALKKVAGGS